jgi:hypothetical protein
MQVPPQAVLIGAAAAADVVAAAKLLPLAWLLLDRKILESIYVATGEAERAKAEGSGPAPVPSSEITAVSASAPLGGPGVGPSQSPGTAAGDAVP